MTDRVICKVNQFTRATEVVQQLRHIPGKIQDLKVKGRGLEDGSIELYLSTGRSSLWDRLSGRAAERREQARTAFKLIQKNERAFLKDEGCTVQKQHKEAISVLLNSAGYDTVPHRGHVLNKDANRRALRSYRFHAQLTELERLFGQIRAEHNRLRPAIAWCEGLDKVKESENGKPELDGLTYQRTLAESGSGDLHVYCDANGRQYAVKVTCPKDKAEAAQAKLDFMCECEALETASKSKAREIVKLVRPPLRTNTGKFVLVMEFAPYGDLHQFIHNTLDEAKRKGLGEASLLKIKAMLLRDIFIGVRAAHRAGVIHGDLKPPNIVIGDRGVAKVRILARHSSVRHLLPRSHELTMRYGPRPKFFSSRRQQIIAMPMC